VRSSPKLAGSLFRRDVASETDLSIIAPKRT
jgi:hypothetical protein